MVEFYFFVIKRNWEEISNSKVIVVVTAVDRQSTLLCAHIRQTKSITLLVSLSIFNKRKWRGSIEPIKMSYSRFVGWNKNILYGCWVYYIHIKPMKINKRNDWLRKNCQLTTLPCVMCMVWKILALRCNYRRRCLFTLIALLIDSKCSVRRCFFCAMQFSPFSVYLRHFFSYILLVHRTCFVCVCSVSSCSPFQQWLVIFCWISSIVILSFSHILCSVKVLVLVERKTLRITKYSMQT